MGTTFLLRDTYCVIVSLRETILKYKVHRVSVVRARHQLVLLLGIEGQGLHGLRHIVAIGIERLGRGIIIKVGVTADVTISVERRFQLLDGHTELHVISHTGLLIEVCVEAVDVIVTLRQSSIEQLATTDDLHTPSAGTHEGQ